MKLLANCQKATASSYPSTRKFYTPLLLCLLATTAFAHAQTFSVIHAFTGGIDGFQPYAGVTIDQGGNLYGTTTEYVLGNVYEMKLRNGGWTFTTLYHFVDYGRTVPQSRVVKGPGGALYGTTYIGGDDECFEFGCGTVYSVRAPQTICRSISCPWSASYVALAQADGVEPGFVDPAFDAAGNMYVTTTQGGQSGYGNVIQLTRSGGQWTPASIHEFHGTDGTSPYSGVTFDDQGNFYGTAWYGGANNAGSVYEMSPSGSGWIFQVIYNFQGNPDGALPVGAPILDAAGNLYGTTETSGPGGGGTVFELSPSGSGWNFTLLYSFPGSSTMYGPTDTLAMDAAGSLYGTTVNVGAFGQGSVFKLTRNGGGWSFTDLHDFTGGADGANPIGSVALDPSGNIYGTASAGGNQNQNCYTGSYPGCGTVWTITP